MTTLRIAIADDDVHEIELKTFDQLTTAEFIRMAERDDDPTDATLTKDKAKLIRLTGAPDRFIRYMTDSEVEQAYTYVLGVLESSNEHIKKLSEVNKTLEEWEEAHERKWNVEDAKQVMEQFGIFRSSVTMGDTTYDAKPLGTAHYGQWIDLESAVFTLKDATESELYAQTLAILMHGADGKYPVQTEHESLEDYSERCGSYTSERVRFFMAAPWVEVMGCAAFFFFNDQRYEAICNPFMRRFQNLSGHRRSAMRRVIPQSGDLMRS